MRIIPSYASRFLARISALLRLNCSNSRREVILYYLEGIVPLVDINKVNARTPEAIRS